MSAQLPVLDGYAFGAHQQVAVWCSHCRDVHVHGNPDNEAEFHRLAHCITVANNPYRAGGYMVRVVGRVSGLGELRPRRTGRRSPLSPKMRFEVLRRDGFRCCLCGDAASNGATLHVDHRTPVAKGGLNNPENLWTLCLDCNLGKGVEELN